MKKNLNQREIPIEIFEGKKPAITHTSTQPIINKITNSNFIKNNKQTITQNNNSKTMLNNLFPALYDGNVPALQFLHCMLCRRI